ncbi:tumor necrosis factor receptor superfamily member 16 [Xiphophorus couchianus]|uniref:tumor necrosis factor receptor superfamily member 16 n=1 Tax=Xiphophorus couchianus TaxID=32473 RepID=UPI001015EE66|nr:tumor necrosis factor receptor superfamily member 16-like [Xiphophorus couchianus]
MTATFPLVILCALATLALASKTERALNVECDSGQFTTGGECCMECPPGEGVVKECGAAQTVCAQCLDSETYSENYSHTEKCKPCTQCTGLMRMETPCTDSNDAKCVCKYNFYFNSVSGRCEPCTVCPLGQGVYSHCDAYHDTICEECVDETFSDRESYLEPCLPCTICEEDIETQLAECTPTSDSVCHNPNMPTDFPIINSEASIFPDYPDQEGSISPFPSGETTTSNGGAPHFLGRGFNENLIPIYCSILAAGVVGLVAYFVFKRWNSCKQNKQPANNRAATNNQMVTPEGEKLHSDSGISVDTQSLQEQQQHAQAEAQPQPSRSHTLEQIVVRVDGSPQPDSPPTEV